MKILFANEVSAFVVMGEVLVLDCRLRRTDNEAEEVVSIALPAATARELSLLMHAATAEDALNNQKAQIAKEKMENLEKVLRTAGHSEDHLGNSSER